LEEISHSDMKPLCVAAVLLIANCCFAYGDTLPGHHDNDRREQQEQGDDQETPAANKDAAEKDAAEPAAKAQEQRGAINPMTGEYYPPTGNGDVINPATGERYPGVPGGYINPNTGEFFRKTE
jgi:hypothetical protein